MIPSRCQSLLTGRSRSLSKSGFAASVVLVSVALGSFVAPAAAQESTPRWPSFRGERASGVGDDQPAPATWDVPAGTNVRWKTAIPGLGLSSPVVWGDRVFLTTAISEKDDAELRVGLYGDIAPVEDDSKHRFVIVCIDRRDGKILWQDTVHEGAPDIRRHPKSSHANSTPATDGRRVVAFFGSEGLYCHDVDGKALWKQDLGRLDSGYYVFPGAQWGFASSPVIAGDRVVVQCDVQKESFLAAFALEDGRELWRTPRKEVPTWSTPTIVARDGGAQIVVNGYLHIGGYDLATGKELWRLQGGGDIPVPTPVVDGERVFVTNAHGALSPIYAVRLGAKGVIDLGSTEWRHEHLAWAQQKGGNYMQTPLVYRELLYCCRDSGVLTVYEAASGDRLYTQRLGAGLSGFTASAVAADGRIYFTSEDGDVHVVRAGKTFELLATNRLGEVAMATPAIVAGEILVRTRRHLVAIGRAESREPQRPAPPKEGSESGASDAPKRADADCDR